ncbi:hypothetical protein AERO8C_170015 [Aeromonas veronii]|uniref:Uncharacterized protein n=1 Tax=Aeromonas veronii TaxID=654 RepID=A0A653L0H7_AERVE|nr:hypothetical protein AERO8C_170015 [Aeromonas veronii]
MVPPIPATWPTADVAGGQKADGVQHYGLDDGYEVLASFYVTQATVWFPNPSRCWWASVS